MPTLAERYAQAEQELTQAQTDYIAARARWELLRELVTEAARAGQGRPVAPGKPNGASAPPLPSLAESY